MVDKERIDHAAGRIAMWATAIVFVGGALALVMGLLGLVIRALWP